MKIHKCAQCGAKFDVSNFAAGKKIRCAKCKTIFEVPADEEAASPPPVPEPEPAAAAEADPDEALTQARPAVKPKKAVAAEAPAPKGGRPATAEAAPRRTRPARETAKPAGSNKGMLIGGIAAGVVALAAGGYFLMGDTFSGPPPKKTLATATTVEEAEKATDMDRLDQILKLVEWCGAKGKTDKKLEFLDKAYILDRTLTSAELKQKLQEHAKELIAAAPEKDAAAQWKVVEWCDQHHLKEDGDARTDYILEKVDADHEGANTRKGNVKIEGKWVEAKLAAEFAKDAEAKKKRQEEIEKMGPRGKVVLEKLEILDQRFGKDSYSYLDCNPKGSPYLLAIQKDKRVLADLRLDELGDVMTQLYKLWLELYGEKLQLTEFKDAVLVIWLYATEKAYRDSGAPAKAAAHFEPMTGLIIVNNELNDPYGVMFHEGIHQLVDYSTRMHHGYERMKYNKFWFTEGIATYFEIFERRGDTFILGRTRPNNNPYLAQCKDLVRREHLMHFGDFVNMDYMAAQQSDNTYSHYAQSWGMTHFLHKYEDGKYLPKFEEYFKAEINGEGGPATFKRIFGDLDALEKEWMTFIDELR